MSRARVQAEANNELCSDERELRAELIPTYIVIGQVRMAVASIANSVYELNIFTPTIQYKVESATVEGEEEVFPRRTRAKREGRTAGVTNKLDTGFDLERERTKHPRSGSSGSNTNSMQKSFRLLLSLLLCVTAKHAYYRPTLRLLLLKKGNCCRSRRNAVDGRPGRAYHTRRLRDVSIRPYKASTG
ncbi:hypothetical protein CBL_10713 [Carabus blaptoides fortunei]